MQTILRRRPLCRLLVAVAATALAGPALAARVAGAAPSASAVQGSAQQSAEVQTDESASLREGKITALDASGTRLQVQGIWLAMVDGKTVAMRQGRPAGLATLRVGETIRFTVAPAGTEAASLRLIYAP